MRLKIVLILSVLTAILSRSLCEARPKLPAPRKDLIADRQGPPAQAENPLGNEPVFGYGISESDAREDARAQARERILTYLTEQYGELAIVLPPALLDRVTNQVGQATKRELKSGAVGWEVQMRVTLTPETLSQIQKLARETRMKERQPSGAPLADGLPGDPGGALRLPPSGGRHQGVSHHPVASGRPGGADRGWPVPVAGGLRGSDAIGR